ncbi:MAG: MBL fold metallo-hydrolase [Candidatus Bathyarchaeota archaeon]|nr:MAG: MBL fold metallo-hydrolase [Candidatus Bathyarchaeota archaeon]
MFTTILEPHIVQIDLRPAGFDNFIASYVVKAERVAIVETGPSATVPNLLAGLEEIEVKVNDVDFVVISHIHIDHGGGAGALLHHLPRAKLVVHKKGAPHAAYPQKLWSQSLQVLGGVAEIYEEPMPVAEDRVLAAEDGMTIDLGGGVQLLVIETLGHASHHQSFYEAKSRGVFPGDAAGVYLPQHNAVIPTTPPPFYLAAALSSLEKLIQFKPKSLFYSHFGRTSDAVQKLEMYGRKLKLWEKIVSLKTKETSDLKEIRKAIEEHDLDLQKAQDYIKTHFIFNQSTVSESIHGFVEYLKKKRT